MYKPRLVKLTKTEVSLLLQLVAAEYGRSAEPWKIRPLLQNFLATLNATWEMDEEKPHNTDKKS